uniref:Uncharacterized protein n=1 Tax=Arundo donax TaxID=35708 RepID=A0A0A8Y5X7_ARUDO
MGISSFSKCSGLSRVTCWKGKFIMLPLCSAQACVIAHKHTFFFTLRHALCKRVATMYWLSSDEILCYI